MKESCLLPPLQSWRDSTSATPALMPRTGLPAAHPVPTRLKHLVTAGRSKAGSGLPPMLVTSARTRCTFKFSDLTPASRALLLSQTGGRHRTQCLVSLLRRLAYGSHCRWRCAGVAVAVSLTPCATSGVLATRALPLEHAVARVCREAGARVARNVRLADMDGAGTDSARCRASRRRSCTNLRLQPQCRRREAASPGRASSGIGLMSLPARCNGYCAAGLDTGGGGGPRQVASKATR